MKVEADKSAIYCILSAELLNSLGRRWVPGLVHPIFCSASSCFDSIFLFLSSRLKESNKVLSKSIIVCKFTITYSNMRKQQGPHVGPFCQYACSKIELYQISLPPGRGRSGFEITDNLSRPLTGTLGLAAMFCAICFTAVATSPKTAVFSLVSCN